MTHPSRSWNRQNLAALAFAAVAVTVGACSGGGPTSWSSRALPNLKGTKATPPTYTFTFEPVDYTQGGINSRVTAIDERANVIVGLNGNSKGTYNSWVADSPGPSQTGYREFRTRDFPGAASTYMSALSNAFYQAGTVFSPPPSKSLACTACGIVYYGKGSGTDYGGGCSGTRQCRWTFIEDPNEGTYSCALTEVLGIAGSNFVVGYYATGASNCGWQGFEAYYDANGQYYADFDVPGADPDTTEATGVNELGDVVGSAEFGGVTKGWLYIDAAYCGGLMAPGSEATYPLGVNWQDEVVGYYQDSSEQTHGFLLLNPTVEASEQVWQTIDDPLASGETVVKAINTHHYITGWYKDAYGNIGGFVGTCTDCKHGDAGRRDAGPVRRGSRTSDCVPAKTVRWKRR